MNDPSESDSPSPEDSRRDAATEPSGHAGAGGMSRHDPGGADWLDALAGRTSLFGVGFLPLIRAAQQAFEGDLGEPLPTGLPEAGADFPAAGDSPPQEIDDDEVEMEDRTPEPGRSADARWRAPDTFAAHADSANPLVRRLREWFGEGSGVAAESLVVTAADELAVEAVIGWARRRGNDSRYRTVTLVGSDLGRTGLCRSASGRPELHGGFGPMMAGFRHVPAGDSEALTAAIDEQTACVLLSPVDWSDAARPLDARFVQAAAELCRRYDAILVSDESRLGFAATGEPLAMRAIAEVEVDAVILGAGLFGGLPGGLVVASRRLTGEPVVETTRYGVQAAVLEATLREAIDRQVLTSVRETMHDLAVSLAETLGAFSFIRDLHVLGMNFGIETDLEAAELVRAMAGHRLRVAAAGDHAIGLQPPAVISSADREALLARLRDALAQLERDFASVGLS